ncbi:hypothetical protein KEM54_006934 [Ascosphaera aggregata]|nr:hypothetical protein KEM54_006934 [Ascosphaera aggregata]
MPSSSSPEKTYAEVTKEGNVQTPAEVRMSISWRGQTLDHPVIEKALIKVVSPSACRLSLLHRQSFNTLRLYLPSSPSSSFPATNKLTFLPADPISSSAPSTGSIGQDTPVPKDRNYTVSTFPVNSAGDEDKSKEEEEEEEDDDDDDEKEKTDKRKKRKNDKNNNRRSQGPGPGLGLGLNPCSANAAHTANTIAMVGVAGLASWSGWRKYVRGEMDGKTMGLLVAGVAAVWGVDWVVKRVICGSKWEGRRGEEEEDEEEQRGRKVRKE